MGDAAGARQAYRTAIRHGGDRWDAWFALGTVSTGEKRIHAILRAHQLNPLSPQIAHFCQGSRDPACKDIRRGPDPGNG
jgi:hypothetical protein